MYCQYFSEKNNGIFLFEHKEEAPANESGALSLFYTTSTYHFRYKVVAVTTVMGINGF
ncbi:hypothetical protein J1TS1_21100 [Shouchella clausii]|nr:hypothetical protein J1TS1_21100 [Shouchella clausii]